MDPTPLSLPEKARGAIANLLGPLLAEECSLSATMREYRRSVTGPHFHSLHKLFEEQRRQLDGWLALLFQRTAESAPVADPALPAGATPRGAGLGPRQMIDDLLGRHEQLSRNLRDHVRKLTDPATADLLRKLADFHDTTAWMLRMLLESPESRRG